MIGFCSSPRFTEHVTGPQHPERPRRITAILDAVGKSKLPLLPIEPVAVDEKWLLSVHTPEHIQRIQRICDAGGGVLDSGDTVVGKSSYEIARRAVGGVLRCCDEVMGGKVRRAFAAVRPPGHHAEANRASGFCLVNNIAIAARYLQHEYGIGRIAIVDFDVHHGNGTQAIFSDDPSVYFISLHQDPKTTYPGTGFEWEIGTGPGRGYTLNIPFPPGAEDVDYMRIIDNRVVPELEEYQPEFLLLSAGFDAHNADVMADTQLTDECFELMTRSLCALADKHCQGRVVSMLEGGYNLDALGRCVVRHLKGMG